MEGKLMAPCRGNTILHSSSRLLPRLCLIPLKVFLSWRHTLQTRLVGCFQSGNTKRHKDTELCKRYAYDSVKKNNWRKPWLNVCEKHNSFLLLWKLRGRGTATSWPPVLPPFYQVCCLLQLALLKWSLTVRENRNWKFLFTQNSKNNKASTSWQISCLATTEVRKEA